VPTYFIDVRADFSGGNPVASVDDIAVRTDANSTPVSPTQYLSALTSAILGKHVLFGTHGFHVDRPHGIAYLSHWSAWLQLGPNGFFVGVLWPGDSRWVPFVDYPIEGDEAIKSGQLLAAYLLKNLTGAATWSFASHSLGARVVLETIRGVKGSPKLNSATLMAGAIDDTCLNDEYQDSASQMQKLSVLASHCDDVLKLAFPVANPVSGIITRGDPYWHGALGRYGPNPPDQPSKLYGTPILPDSWKFGHVDYINWDGKVTGPPPFPQPVTVPSNSQAPLPSYALPPQNAEIPNWKQALAAGFVSSRFS
jgi:Alpha/beta hydrolase of unknown function (DUF900)